MVRLFECVAHLKNRRVSVTENSENYLKNNYLKELFKIIMY